MIATTAALKRFGAKMLFGDRDEAKTAHARLAESMDMMNEKLDRQNDVLTEFCRTVAVNQQKIIDLDRRITRLEK